MIFALLENYWPHILAVLSVILGLGASIHAIMTKQDVRSAIGWVGVIMLSPILGALIYVIFGINRLSRRAVELENRGDNDIGHALLEIYDLAADDANKRGGSFGTGMKMLGDHLCRCAITSGNEIRILTSGDEAYQNMMEAIDAAKRSILLESYIFDRDAIGAQFVDRLEAAVQRGVEVRVLIDAVGARYSFPSIVHSLRRKNIRCGVFNGNIIMGLRLPYANLRTHRKILVVDGERAFSGGMNIREAFSDQLTNHQAAHDTHFEIYGPAVSDLFQVAAEHWYFTTREKLDTAPWQVAKPRLETGTGMAVRVVPSGPDRSMETNQNMLIGAFSQARHSIAIRTPYLLPDRELISALVTAARRGVMVDIFVPQNNNLRLVDCAMRAQFSPLLKGGCRLWRAGGAFDHSKLIAVDNLWAYIGSSNLDPRSLRLNFEIDMEVLDQDFAKEINGRIMKAKDNAKMVTLQALKNRSFILRLVDRVIWLGSPYL